jgi:iron complex transport system substrate-binding protein
VSLLPSATEIVCALGLEDHLIAVTHECDFPPAVQNKPVITSSVLDHCNHSSRHIHEGISGLLHQGRSIYHLNEKLLAELQPDLILTQELCDVCAVSYHIVRDAARILQGDTEIISLEPNSVSDILANIRLVGQKTNRDKAAQALIEEFEKRINRIMAKTAGVTERPRVYCMEWLDPPFAAGHWIPEMVSLAGGIEGLGRPGQPSKQIAWQEVLDFAPEILVLMPCGFNLKQTLEEAEVVRAYPDWESLPAVRDGRVVAVDGSAYFNRPGPRIIAGLEILAQIIHPRLFRFLLPLETLQT